MSLTYRLISRSANVVRFADPDSFFNDVTIKMNVQPKKAGARTVYNAASSLNLSRTVTLPQPEGCTDKCAPLDQEKLSLRFSLSGSTQSKTEVTRMIDDFIVLLEQHKSDLVSGFLPEVSSLPVGTEVP